MPNTLPKNFTVKLQESTNNYCEWLYFHGVPIFVVFADGPIDQFQYLRHSANDLLFKLYHEVTEEC